MSWFKTHGLVRPENARDIYTHMLHIYVYNSQISKAYELQSIDIQTKDTHTHKCVHPAFFFFLKNLHFQQRLNLWYEICVLCGFTRSGMSNSLWSHELYQTGLLCPWSFPGKNTWVGCHFLPEVIIQSPGMESTSPVSPTLAGRFFTTEPPRKPMVWWQ